MSTTARGKKLHRHREEQQRLHVHDGTEGDLRSKLQDFFSVRTEQPSYLDTTPSLQTEADLSLFVINLCMSSRHLKRLLQAQAQPKLEKEEENDDEETTEEIHSLKPQTSSKASKQKINPFLLVCSLRHPMS